jgi:hypothetical protein
MTWELKELESTCFCDKNLQVTSVGVFVIVVSVFVCVSFRYSR